MSYTINQLQIGQNAQFCIGKEVSMIKETVDAVRLAELEGDKVISTAKVNGQDMKNQIKIQGAEYRTERLKEAKEKAEKEMAETVAKCEKYKDEQQKEIDLKVMQLKNKSYEKMDGTVKAIVEYLF